MSQGYRKIPGNRCYGGVDLNPYSYSCSVVGGVFSFRTILYLTVIALALYYGWPVIEALLIILPIPDPKTVIEKGKSIFASVLLSAASLASRDNQSPAQPKPSTKGPGYASNFNQAPDTLGESDEEDDVGKVPKLRAKRSGGLSYGDSDDEEKDSS